MACQRASMVRMARALRWALSLAKVDRIEIGVVAKSYHATRAARPKRPSRPAASGRRWKAGLTNPMTFRPIAAAENITP